MWFLINGILIKLEKAIKWNGTQVWKSKMWNKEQQSYMMEQKGVVEIEGRKAGDTLFEGSLILCQFELLSG